MYLQYVRSVVAYPYVSPNMLLITGVSVGFRYELRTHTMSSVQVIMLSSAACCEFGR